MKKLGLIATCLAFIPIQFGCNGAAICDCAYDYNIELEIRKGDSEQCILDPRMSFQADSIRSVQTHEIPIDSSSCSVSLSSGKGTSLLILNKEDYPEVRIKIENIKFHDSDCCGHLDKKKFRIKWYELDEAKEPVVVEID